MVTRATICLLVSEWRVSQPMVYNSYWAHRPTNQNWWYWNCISEGLRECGNLKHSKRLSQKNSFDINKLPDYVFHDATLMASDLNSRHTKLGDTDDRNNANGAIFWQFLQDHSDALLLRNPEATHVKGGRLDYACLINGGRVSGGVHRWTRVAEWPFRSQHYASPKRGVGRKKFLATSKV